MFYPDKGNNEGRRLPDYEYVYNELAKLGVTLSLLWAEYCAKCEAEHTIPYQHTQFNDKYHAYAVSKKAKGALNFGKACTIVSEYSLCPGAAKKIF